MTQFYRDDQGRYVGAFVGVNPPAGSIEVPSSPEHAAQIWINGQWTGVIVPPVVSRFQALAALHGAGYLHGITPKNSGATVRPCWPSAAP
jgi:hypothetical protein